MMTRALPIAALAAALSFPATSRAAESFDACTATIVSLPAVLSSSGRYCLVGDVATAMASGNAIDINANNVTIDCNGFKIGNLAAGAATQTAGVLMHRLNGTVTGCHFRGFKAPVIGVGAHGARIENNVFEGGRYYGLYLAGDGTTIRGNRFVDIGGTVGGEAIRVDGSGEIRDNLIDGVTTASGSATGITGYGDFVVIDNTIRGLVGPTTDNAVGISFSGEDTQVFIERNHLQARVDEGTGVNCPPVAIFRDNSVIGFAAPWSGCTDHGRNAKHAAEP